MKKFSLIIVSFLAVYCLSAQGPTSAGRAALDPAYAPFYHGVASGDPLPNNVIIWTRITSLDNTVNVGWQVAADTTFNTLVQSGSLTTDSSRDYTVKVDVGGLQPGTWYYYRFNALGKNSLIGRTRTADIGDNDSLRFAVVSCSNFQAGFFNAYKHIAERNDLAAVIHLGDYIYEYPAGGYGFFGDTNSNHVPATEILTLSDYRIRHSQYKLDPDLRKCHQQYPFIAVWDDHESANDAYKDGAENHSSATEGSWLDRKSVAVKSYFEWMPIRETNGADSIYRTLKYGDLADLILIDTRLEGREEQAAGANDPSLNDPSRTLLGTQQLSWFKDKLSASTSRWKLIGNQVMVSPLIFNSTPFNLDQWDGYPKERANIFGHIKSNNIKNVVFLTGDIHTSWGNDLPDTLANYVSSSGAGSIAVEYVCTSVTSPGLTGIGNTFVPILRGANPYMKYIDLEKKGYLLLDLNKQRTQGDWVFVNTVTNKNFTTSVGGSWYTDNNLTFLRQASSPVAPKLNPAPFAPAIRSSVGLNDFSTIGVVVSCYPNPVDDEVNVQYYLYTTSIVAIDVYDMQGKLCYSGKEIRTSGLFEANVPMEKLKSGVYTLSIKADGKAFYSKQIVKK
jgi:alkaline phosphatase D